MKVVTYKSDAYGNITPAIALEGEIVGFVGLVNKPYAIVRVGNKLRAMMLEEMEIQDAGMDRTTGTSSDTGADGCSSERTTESKASLRRGKGR